MTTWTLKNSIRAVAQVLVFLATLVYRKKVDQKLALALNVARGPCQPWPLVQQVAQGSGA